MDRNNKKKKKNQRKVIDFPALLELSPDDINDISIYTTYIGIAHEGVYIISEM